ncbi:MAG: GGDEF domain-containing protein [Comamonas sp.]
MSAASRSHLQRQIYGPADFAEHEELLAFQHRFLIAIALASVGFNLALVAVFQLKAPNSEHLSWALGYWSLAALANLALWSWLKRHPRRLKTGSLLIALLYWGNLVFPLQWLPPDPLLTMWTLLLVVGGFIMLGRWWGWLFCAIAMVTCWWQLRLIDLSAFPESFTTMVFSTVAGAVLGHTYTERFQYLFSRLSHHNAELLRLSTYDPLTQALNASAYYQQCNTHLALCHRMDLPFCVLFVDLDHFKRINDTYGHAMGDHVLQQATRVLRSCLRESDLLGRVGGEEFSIFLPNTPHDGGLTVAERIRSAIEAHDMGLHGQMLRVTASVGLTWSQCRSPAPQAIHVIQQLADKAMYDAKHAGRNRVSSFVARPQAPPEPALHAD